MIIAILQPSYLPWIGYFEQILKSDIFVFYDDVQYDKHSWRNRNRIKTPQGIQWLTVPVIVNFNDRPEIMNVRIENKQNWRRKHLLSIRANYAKAPHFDRYFNFFETLYSQEWGNICELNIYIIEEFVQWLGLGNKKFVRSSTLDVKGDTLERLVNICKIYNCDVFYEGSAGRNYINDEFFNDSGITVKYQDYVHPIYQQLHGEFIPYLSVIDLIFNHGDDSLDILGGKKCL